MSTNTEHRADEARRPEVTVVTTLQVTHVLRDCSDMEEAQLLAAVIARTAREALEEGYREGVLPQGQPDDISVGSVQVFAFDGESESESAPERAEA